MIMKIKIDVEYVDPYGTPQTIVEEAENVDDAIGKLGDIERMIEREEKHNEMLKEEGEYHE